MNLVRHLPNLLTLTNLFLGIVGIIAITEGRDLDAVYCMGGSLLADMLDGALARKLGVDNALGIQLDSLADVVTFGALPSMMIYFIGTVYGTGDLSNSMLIILAALPGVSAGLRLGRFNVDSRPRAYFWGLATPAGGILVAGWLWAEYADRMYGWGASDIPGWLVVIPVFLSVSYQVPLRLPGLKSPLGGKITAGVIGLLVVLGFFLHGPIAIPAGIILYVLTGVANLLFKWY